MDHRDEPWHPDDPVLGEEPPSCFGCVLMFCGVAVTAWVLWLLAFSSEGI